MWVSKQSNVSWWNGFNLQIEHRQCTPPCSQLLFPHGPPCQMGRTSLWLFLWFLERSFSIEIFSFASKREPFLRTTLLIWSYLPRHAFFSFLAQRTQRSRGEELELQSAPDAIRQTQEVTRAAAKRTSACDARFLRLNFGKLRSNM